MIWFNARVWFGQRRAREQDRWICDSGRRSRGKGKGRNWTGTCVMNMLFRRVAEISGEFTYYRQISEAQDVSRALQSSCRMRLAFAFQLMYALLGVESSSRQRQPISANRLGPPPHCSSRKGPSRHSHGPSAHALFVLYGRPATGTKGSGCLPIPLAEPLAILV